MNPTRKTQRGITLVEQLVALAVTAIAAGTAAPAFERMSQQRHLEGAAQVLRADLQHARALAVAQGQPVRVQFHSDDAGACYVIHTGPRGECRCSANEAAQCSDRAVPLRGERFAASSGVRLTSNSASMLFDGSLGTVTPTGTMELSNRQSATLRLVINIMGRVRQCTTTPDQVKAPVC